MQDEKEFVDLFGIVSQPEHGAGCLRGPGYALKGYFVWSLLDNLEWGYGFTQRFGLIWVDFKTQQRINKDSANWYSKVIAANGL